MTPSNITQLMWWQIAVIKSNTFHCAGILLSLLARVAYCSGFHVAGRATIVFVIVGLHIYWSCYNGKWKESGFRPPLCSYRLNWTRKTSWGWWDDWDDSPPDTGFEIWALAVWGRARYLSVTEAPHNTDFHTWMGEKHLILSNRRDREPNPELWRERQRC